jgi:hypothetical protein
MLGGLSESAPMLFSLLGYFFCMITMLTTVVVLLIGFSNISSFGKGASLSPSCNRSDGYGGDTTAFTGRERSIASKGCVSPGRCHCKRFLKIRSFAWRST